MILYAPIIGIGGVIKVAQTHAGMEWVIALAVLVILGFVMLLTSLAMPKFKIMQNLVQSAESGFERDSDRIKCHSCIWTGKTGRRAV